MAMKDFDFKQFMIQKGERVGLGVAGFLAILLILFSVKSFFGAGPKKNADVLEKMTKDLNGKLATNVPTKPDDKPKDPEASLGDFNFNIINDPSAYRVASLFLTQEPVDMNRRQPELFTAVEGKVAIVQAQTMSYMLKKDEKTGKLLVKVKLDSTGTGTGTAGMGTASNDVRKMDNSRFNKNFGAGSRGGRGQQGYPPSMYGSGRFNNGESNSREFTGAGEDVKSEWIPVDSLNEKQNATLMKTIRPVRMAEIAASFPYKAEVDEFRKKLRLPSLRSVLEEASVEEVEDTDENGGAAQKINLESFRFLGVAVQRRQVDSQGKPVFPDAGPAKDGWDKIDIVGEYKPLLVLSNMQTQEEDPDLDTYGLLNDGLVMQRLLSLREDQYPKLETELPTIQKTIAKIKEEKKKDTIIGTSKNFDPDNFNVFKKGNVAANGNAAPNGLGNAGSTASMPRSGSNRRNFGMPQRGAKGDGPAYNPMGMQNDNNFLVPDYCLIRVIDVTVKPGESYQYRLRVRMANPNYGLQERVADPNFADRKESNKELKPDPKKMWYEIPGIVTVPTEMHYYAVDQKAIDGDKYAGGYKNVNPSRDQVVLQIHKYLENAAPTRGKNVPVGESSVAERVIVSRGEAIDRPVRVKVPVLVEELGDFKLASTLVSSEKGASRDPGIDVHFDGIPGRPAILVDFDSADQRYKRAGGTEIRERPAQEVLILGPDGKLQDHNTNVDANDKASPEDLKNGKEGRIDRYNAWKKRIEDLEAKAKGDNNPMGGMPPASGDPFRRGPRGPGRN